jgi:hypothetical protein
MYVCVYIYKYTHIGVGICACIITVHVNVFASEYVTYTNIHLFLPLCRVDEKYIQCCHKHTFIPASI